MRFSPFTNRWPRSVIPICVLALAHPLLASLQEPNPTLQKPAAPAEPEAPFTIEQLGTRVRFEADGASRREVHTIIKINSEAGARQFSRLNFDYNRGFEQVEIPLLRILHANGGTTEILPSAISDQPNPAVVDAPAYHDVRRKTARILGLQAGDTLEYRVVTTVSNHPLAPDFWLTLSFARGGTVAEETYELDLPASRQVQMRINPATPAAIERSGDDPDARITYRWRQRSDSSTKSQIESTVTKEADVALTTFGSWQVLAERLTPFFSPPESAVKELFAKGSEIVQGKDNPDARIMAVYEFVSQKIRTVKLPFGASGFQTRAPAEIISSGYATPEDKHVLFAALGNNFFGPARADLVLAATNSGSEGLPLPSALEYLLTMSGYPSITFLMDLSLEVAPYRVIPSQYRGKQALLVGPARSNLWWQVDNGLPFPATQVVNVSANLAGDGKLTAKVKYALRGDNELLLRVAFHRAPREQWKNLTQLLSLSDGFRGEVSNVIPSDPSATRAPFTLEYDIAQPNFVNWSKPPVRLPIPLPTLGLPEAPTKGDTSIERPIDLGTPLEVETRVTLRLPSGTTARAPVPTTVRRDYAEFSSTYAVRAGTLTASRRLKFLLRDIPAASAADYAAFVRAVQNDEAQECILGRAPAIGPAPTTRTPSRPAAPRKPN